MPSLMHGSESIALTLSIWALVSTVKSKERDTTHAQDVRQNE